MLYEVFLATDNETGTGPRFRRLDDAVAYVRRHAGSTSLAIRAPNGDWVHVRPRSAPNARDSVWPKGR